MFTIHREKKMYIFCLILVVSMTFFLVGCSHLFKEEPKYISYVIENMEEAEKFFQAEQMKLDICKEDETTYLEITTALDEVYRYRDSSYFDRLCKVEKKVSREENGEIEERQFIMRVKDDELASVCVKAEVGGSCLDYYLPDFDKIVSRWGDTMYAQTIIELFISPQEMTELYETGQEIEQTIIEFYEQHVEEKEGKKENNDIPEYLRTIDSPIIHIVEREEYSEIPKQLEIQLKNVLLENSFDEFISEHEVNYRILEKEEINQFVEMDESGKLKDYNERFAVQADVWLLIEENSAVVIRHPLGNGEYVYYEYIYANEKEELPYVMRALGKNGEFFYIRWNEEIYLITPKKQEDKLIGVATYCMHGKSEYGWLLYQEKATDTYVVTKYFEYTSKEASESLSSWPMLDTRTSKYKYISDNYWSRVDGSNMYYAKSHDREQPQKLIDYCVEALQNGDLIEQLESIEAEYEIIVDEEKRVLIEVEHEVGLSMYSEGFEEDDIWYKVSLSNEGDDIVVTHQEENGVVVNLYFWNNKESGCYNDTPVCTGGQKKSNPYFIEWDNKNYLAMPFWNEEKDELIGVLIYHFVGESDGTAIGIGINSDNTINISVEDFFPVQKTINLPDDARQYPTVVEY